jgi:hypothetical protein
MLRALLMSENTIRIEILLFRNAELRIWNKE